MEFYLGSKEAYWLGKVDFPLMVARQRLFQAWVEVVVGNAAINEHEMLGGLAECEWKYHHQHPCCTECGGIRPGPCCSVDECACDAVASESGTT